MPEIDVSAEQSEYLEELRAALADEHLGAYGTMRTRDALQYLIDRHEATRDDALVVEGDEAGEASSDETETVGDDEDETGDDAGGSSDAPANPLQAAQQLLDEHDDVWEEVDSDSGKYAVTLPDGSTEYARTRDDVRALLFKHY